MIGTVQPIEETAPPYRCRAPAGDPPPDATGSLEFIQWKHLDPLYAGVVEAVEEAVLNALTANEDMTGRLGHRSPALPRDRLGPLLAGGCSRSAPPSVDASLLAEIEQIRAIDNHAHPVRVAGAGEAADREFDALLFERIGKNPECRFLDRALARIGIGGLQIVRLLVFLLRKRAGRGNGQQNKNEQQPPHEEAVRERRDLAAF